jgi:hypothetical protein
LYVGFKSDGSVHLIMSASSSFPDIPKPSGKNHLAIPSHLSSDTTRQYVEIISRRLEVDEWIQVDVSMSHTGPRDLASRDLYNISIVINGQIDVTGSGIFRG